MLTIIGGIIVGGIALYAVAVFFSIIITIFDNIGMGKRAKLATESAKIKREEASHQSSIRKEQSLELSRKIAADREYVEQYMHNLHN